ncbi:hypothetical protein GCM10022278_38460 [Allohahella marinimesophila]|uniref:Parallel beta helix pectate lyase-like protein n=1 Tax=Allohahella marinimesophila TaxID=1054972 RepID=A0ABP7Q841_9GAMM
MTVKSVLGGALLIIAMEAGAQDLWVSKVGSDKNSCSEPASKACLTIQKAVSVAKPGDVINITAGRYVENSALSKFTKRCAWLDDLTASLCIEKGGSADKPLIIRAAPGEEGHVVIDSESKRVGIHTQNADFITISGLKIINSRVVGIASWGQATVEIPDYERLGVGLVIENNSIVNTTGPHGVNTSAIGMWGSKDWIVRNNLITGVSVEGASLGSGIKAYGVINALIEHNEIYNTDLGIYWKDHHVADKRRTLFDESIIQYNKINASTNGVYISARPGGTAAGNNIITKNIIYGYEGSGIRGNTAAADFLSGDLVVTNNLFDGENNRSSEAITVDSQRSVEIYGNIIVRNKIDIATDHYSPTKFGHLTRVDYNIYDNDVQFLVDRYSKSRKGFNQLGAWKNSSSDKLFSVKTADPDANSVNSDLKDIFTSIQDKNYHLPKDSIARKFLPDGSNAGPYQHGDEEIGIQKRVVGKVFGDSRDLSLSQ